MHTQQSAPKAGFEQHASAPNNPHTRLRRSFALRQLLPRSFLGRSLLIVMVPMLLVQLVSSYIFFERHWEHVTRFLSQSTAFRLKSGLALFEHLDASEESKRAKARFLKMHVGMNVQLVSHVPPLPKGHHLFQSRFERALNKVLRRPYTLLMKENLTFVWFAIAPEKILCFSFPTKWVLTRTSVIWFLWSLGSSFLFALLAAFFMRQQIAPLKSLARMAKEARGGGSPKLYIPKGALEIRAVGHTLARTLSDLQQKNKAQQDMLMGVSHDMQTPLARMKLQLALMPPDQEGVAALLEDVKQMTAMVKSYIAFMRGGYLLAPKRFVPLRTLFAALKALDAKSKKQVSLNVPRNFFVTLDESAFLSCVQNLLANALCYARSKVHVSLMCERDYFCFSVEDDGEGVAPGDLKRIFQPFVRLDKGRKLDPALDTGQTGLGLSIVENLAHKMGGEATTQRASLGGLCVVLRLPYVMKT